MANTTMVSDAIAKAGAGEDNNATGDFDIKNPINFVREGNASLSSTAASWIV